MEGLADKPEPEGVDVGIDACIGWGCTTGEAVDAVPEGIGGGCGCCCDGVDA